MNDPMNNNQINQINTDAEMEAQFNERNKNLKQSLNQIVDTAANKTQQSSTSDLGNITSSATSSVPTEHHSFLDSDWGHNKFDRKLMNSIEVDILAMHSTDPELFENVASKVDETFGLNALV